MRMKGAIMRGIGVTLLVVFLAAGIAGAQTPMVGLYADTQGTDCEILDLTPGLLNVYVVVTGIDCATAVEYWAPKPACFTATYLSDLSVFAVVIGTSQTGVSIGFGTGLTSPVHVQTISFFGQGSSLICCQYPVLPHPFGTSGVIELVDCAFDLVDADGLTSVINGNPTCPCEGGTRSSLPTFPSPPTGATGQAIDTDLSWDVTHPENGPFTYDLHFGVSPDGVVPVAWGLTERTYDPGLLTPNTSYHWRVDVHDAYGQEVEGVLWSFMTGGAGTVSVETSYSAAYCGYVPGDTLNVDLVLHSALAPVDDFGADVTFDPLTMSLAGCEPGEAIEGWSSFEYTNLGSSVRVTAAGQPPVAAWTTASLVHLRFVVDVCAIETPAAFPICPENFSGDISATIPICRTFYYKSVSHTGDLTDDGGISPQDALCAFNAYLSFPEPPAEECAPFGWEIKSDVDCSQSLTPADALCIFSHWLNGSCSFCGPMSSPRPVAGSLRDRTVSLLRLECEEGTMRLAVHAEGASGMRSFGFELSHPSWLEYTGLERTEATSGFIALGGRIVGENRVRIGGYSHDPVTGSEADLVVVRFRAAAGEAGGAAVAEAFVDDLGGAVAAAYRFETSNEETPEISSYHLHQNQPNPFNPTTRIRYEIPRSEGIVAVTLAVYDVGGRRVRDLYRGVRGGGVHYADWDGTDDRGRAVSSGVYFCVLRAGPQTLTRKMALLK
jgi:hypothetical protein